VRRPAAGLGAVFLANVDASAFTQAALDSGWAVLAVTACLIAVLGGALTRSPARRPS
jgi:hypothetical protein